MASITNYTGQDLSGASIEGAGFRLIEAVSRAGQINDCFYICGKDAIGYEKYVGYYSARANGLVKNTGESITAGPMTPIGTAMVCSDLDGQQDFIIGDYLRVGNEIMKVGNVSYNANIMEIALSVQRAYFDTIAGTHEIGSPVYKYAKGDLDIDFFGDIKALTNTEVSIDGGATLALLEGTKLSGQFTKIKKTALGVCLIQRR